MVRRTITALLLALVAIAAFTAHVSHADTPVHCLYEDVIGVWEYESQEAIYNNVTIHCDGKYVSTEKIEFQYPDIAIDGQGNKGKWTLVYDEGVEVTVGNRVFFQFFAYREENGQIISECGRTFEGYSYNIDRTAWACSRAQRISPPAARSERVTPPPKPLSEEYLNQPASDFLKAVADEVNADPTSTFTASDHSKAFEGKTVRDLLVMSGHRNKRVSMLDHIKSGARVAKPTPPLTHLPDEFDWRNASGRNYDSPVRSQGSCGSCYAFAALAQAEGRIRVRSRNKEQPILSPLHAISCNPYTQGCNGGYDFLVGKFGRDWGFIEERCAPYEPKEVDCASIPACEDGRYQVLDYYIVGGFYGATTESLIMDDIFQNGPISVNMLSTPKFAAYKDGIYEDDKSHIHNLEFDPFLETNHLITIVGWGVERGVKFWWIKNSWGTDWGINGYAKVRKGVNTMNIESFASGFLFY